MNSSSLTGDLVLPFLDPLGEGDLALTRQEGDAAHLAQIEAHRILGAADGPGRQVDRLGRAVVIGLLGWHRLALAPNLRGEPPRLCGVDDLDVHCAEHHHDVVELVE